MLRVSLGSDGAGGEGAAEAQLLAGDPQQERRQGIEEAALQQVAALEPAALEPAAGGSPYQRAVAACAAQPDLACLTAAARQPAGEREFRFPHAFIVGWQKSATTSLYATLMHHPSVLASKVKVRRGGSQLGAAL